jgi:hypothetical protein
VIPHSYSHIFSHHELRPLDQGAEFNLAQELIWPSIFLLVCLLLLAFIKARAFGRVVRIVQSTFSTQILQQLEREELNSSKIHSIGLSAFFLLNLSFLLYKMNSIYGLILVKTDSSLQFFFFFALTLLLFAGKTLAIRLLALFTDSRRLVADYRTSTTLVNQTFGLFIFPFLVLSEFTDWNPRYFLWTAVSILALSTLLKWYRGLIMSVVDERIGLLQIFSYFCGLEILPLLTVAKFIVEKL